MHIMAVLADCNATLAWVRLRTSTTAAVTVCCSIASTHIITAVACKMTKF